MTQNEDACMCVRVARHGAVVLQEYSSCGLKGAVHVQKGARGPIWVIDAEEVAIGDSSTQCNASPQQHFDNLWQPV